MYWKAIRLVLLATPAVLAQPTFCGAQAVHAVTGAYLRQNVDKPATPRSDMDLPPRYPDTMRNAKRDGVVRVRFVVDRRGVPQPSTFQVVQSEDSSFTASVRRAVSDWRFTPARRKGTRVPQVVELGFYFGLADLPQRVFKDKEIDVFIIASPAGSALPD